MTPGKKLARARKRNGFASQKKLAERITSIGFDIAESRIARFEQDKVKKTTIEEIRAVCEAMPGGMSLDWWLSDDKVSLQVIQKRLAGLSSNKRQIVLQLIDGLQHL